MDNLEIFKELSRIRTRMDEDALYRYPCQWDETTTLNVTYVRFVRNPSDMTDDAPLSAILRVDESGAITTIYWADGNKNFDNVWANRAALTYLPLSV